MLRLGRTLAAPVAVAAALAAAAAAAPASATAASWSPVRDATRAGQAFAPAVAADARGRFTIGFIRQRGDVHRLELRRGLFRQGLRGDGVVLDASESDLGSLTLTQSATGRVGAAWLRHADRAQGPRTATVTASGDVRGPVNLVPQGTESASAPRWVAGPGATTLLVWDRPSGSAAAMLEDGTFGTPSPLPGSGTASQVSVVAHPDGARIAVWATGGRVLCAHAQPGAPFGTPATLSGPGTARDPQLVLREDGTAAAAWVRNQGAGNVMEVATRPPGGAFGAPVAVSSAGEGAFSPRLVAASTGDVVAVWVSATTARGWGGARGPLKLRRVAADGTVDGPAATVTPDRVRTAEPALADDGRGALFIGWSAGPLAAREIGVRRLTDAGLDRVRTLAAGRWEATTAPVLAAAAGRAVMAWTANGIVRLRLLR
jgi:hypothetical protein